MRGPTGVSLTKKRGKEKSTYGMQRWEKMRFERLSSRRTGQPQMKGGRARGTTLNPRKGRTPQSEKEGKEENDKR